MAGTIAGFDPPKGAKVPGGSTKKGRPDRITVAGGERSGDRGKMNAQGVVGPTWAIMLVVTKG